MKNKKVIIALLDNLIWPLLILIVIIFHFISDKFLTTFNITNILIHAAVLGILTVGQSFTLITGNFDLSAESTLAIAALIGAWLILPSEAPNFGGDIFLPVGLAIIALLVLGLIAGWINGFLITRLKMNNFIVTLAMMIILRGFMLVISEGNTMSGLPDAFKALGHNDLGKIPVSVLMMVIVFIIAHIIMQYTQFGRNLYAVGGNRDAALAAGISPDKHTRQVYLISGFLAALGGLMLAGRTGVICENMGSGMIFEIQAAAVIGGISLQGGRGMMLGAFGGVLLLSIIDSGLSLMRVSSFWIEIFSGLIILVAMTIDAQKVRYSTIPTVESKLSIKKAE